MNSEVENIEVRNEYSRMMMMIKMLISFHSLQLVDYMLQMCIPRCVVNIFMLCVWSPQLDSF